ncbi:hypothetical protein GEMRC1_005576 [Eukaryota sp. GEM-RC1]
MQNSIISSKSWVIEKTVPPDVLAPDDVDLPLESSQRNTFFQTYFTTHHHSSYTDLSDEDNPILISVFSFRYQSCRFFRLVYRSSAGMYSGDIESSEVQNSFLRKLFCIGPTMNNVVSSIVERSLIPSTLRLTSIPTTQELVQQLIEMEKEVDHNRKVHKIGVLYVEKDQTSENEIYSNKRVSEKFEEFLDELGDRVRLLGFKGYDGGLSTTKDYSGRRSVYREWKEHEFMFHVAPYLPFSESDEQQIARKRHVGNDGVVIVFLNDRDSTFDPSLLISQQNQIVITIKVVRQLEKKIVPNS